MKRIVVIFAGLGCAFALAQTAPRGVNSLRIFMAGDSPEAATRAAIMADRSVLSARRMTDEIRQALEADDPDLAASFIELAQAEGLTLAPELKTRVAEAVAADGRPAAQAARFADGFVTGRARDGAALAGTIAGDLTVYGDVRDLAREGWHAARGDSVDKTMVALAGAGLAVTAGAYVSLGAAAPVRAGLSLFKGARRSLKLGSESAQWLGKAVSRAGKSERGMQTLLTAARDAGRIEAKLGTRGAFDALALARSPKDVARVARLAESRGSQTRALLKLFGRGAIVLGSLAFDLAGWLLWLVLSLFGVLAWIKATTESLTAALLRRSKRRKMRALALVPASG